MSVDSGVVNRKDRSFISGKVVSGSVEGVRIDDCPPGFENAAGWGYSGFQGLCKSEMHGDDLCEIGDGMRFSAGSDTNFVDRKLVGFTKGNVVCAARDYNMEMLNKSTAVTRKRNVKEAVESVYVAGSLVWGKIRSHPWWPGQIFDPADLSKEALRNYKGGKFLVAYFGDGTFAWNDVTQIRPFQLNFESMVSQCDLETFCCAVGCALDEVFKRAEFGLSCTCLPENVYRDMQSQIVENSGIYKITRRRDAGDEYSSVECFVPSKLVSYVKEAAVFPTEVSNKLEMVKCKAQLTSFCRWKGYRKLPEYTYFRGLLDNNANSNLDGGDSHSDVVNNAQHVVMPKSPKFAITEDKGERQHKRRGRPRGTAGKKRKKISHSDSDELYVPPNHVKVNRIAKRKVRLETPTSENNISISVSNSGKMKLDRVISDWDSCITSTVGRNIADVMSPDVLFKHLASTAADPFHDNDCLIPLVKFFSQFRNSVFQNHSVSPEPCIPVDKKSNEMIGKVISEYKDRVPQSGYVEESYSMDRIVKESAGNKCSTDPHDEQRSVVAEPSTRLDSPILESEVVPQLHVFSDPSGNQESAEAFLNASGNQVSDNHKDTLMRTALLLRFSEKGHVPSVTDLNKIFSCYGPLHDSETKIMRRCLAKVIFKKHCDAEVAFSSTGKYSIFGPSLISYRLKYLIAKPKTVSSQSRKRQKKAAPIEKGNTSLRR